MSNAMSVPSLPDLDSLSLDELKKLVVQLLVEVTALREENQQLDHQLLQLVERQGVQIWKRRYGHGVRQPCPPSSWEALTSPRHTRRPGKLTKSAWHRVRCLSSTKPRRPPAG